MDDERNQKPTGYPYLKREEEEFKK